ncbi:MAG: hypothetical protein JRH15_20100 [Deltaproteobacteria bacterium]|nr:hypothetical protein [Deltaproteobacteria bacterium]
MASVPLYKTFMNIIQQLTGDDPEESILETLGVSDTDLLRDLENFQAYKLNKQREFANRIASARNTGNNEDLVRIKKEWEDWDTQQSESGRFEYVITPEQLKQAVRAREKIAHPLAQNCSDDGQKGFDELSQHIR